MNEIEVRKFLDKNFKETNEKENFYYEEISLTYKVKINNLRLRDDVFECLWGCYVLELWLYGFVIPYYFVFPNLCWWKDVQRFYLLFVRQR